MARYKAKLSGEALKKFFREKWTAATAIQCAYRGYWGRERVRKLKIELALRHYAAREVQRIYRGTRVLGWRDMRLNVIAAFVLDRHYVERKSAIQATRMRYRQYILGTRDSLFWVPLCCFALIGGGLTCEQCAKFYSISTLYSFYCCNLHPASLSSPFLVFVRPSLQRTSATLPRSRTRRTWATPG